MDLQDRVAVVTGASRGLGRAFSDVLIGAGARVYGLARSSADLAAVRAELGEAFVPVEADVTDRAAVRDAFARVGREAGRCDVLVNNAGLGRFAPVDELTDDAWDAQVNTNLTALFTCTREAVRLMKAKGAGDDGLAGHIVHVASVAGLVGNPNMAAYNATKFGVRGFAEATMKELRGDGIRVTCLYPGSVDTDFAAGAGSKGNPHALQPEDVAETLVHVLRAPARCLISEVVLRPTRPA
ncbi:MAG TPA: SDR family NAD(P)-dependent oxidoreductase [Rhodothermales bacterium]|nr:SDR family NAD(P)-dependent oxidoreductase [Rhodothermales bacterium]